MKKLWMVLALMLVGSLSCTTKPIYYELPAAPGFRMHDKAVKSTLVAADSFLVEDSESANTTKYTTMADINTYLGSIYQPLTAYLTDLGDGNITSNFVNTTYPWADNEISSSTNWNTAYTERREWSGSDTHLVAGTGRASLGLGSAATRDAEDTFSDGSNLPDGHAIKTYGDSNWSGGVDDATYITQTSNGSLSAEQALNALATGLLRSTNGTGVVDSIPISSDIEAMLGSANDTALVTEIGAEPALTNEAAFYARIIDVSQFYELGDNITTASGTVLPSTCMVGQTFLDTDEDTDGLRCECVSTNTWKCGQNALSGDKISEGDSNVEVIDAGTGQVDIDVDGDLRGRFNAEGLTVNGTLECDGVEVGAVANPRIRALDSGCPGTDKFIGSIDWQYVDGGDGAENGDIFLKSQEGGANTTQMQYDESASAWEIPSGKNLALLGGSIAGRTPIGADITANIALNTTDLHGKFYVVTAACTVTLDKVTDAGFGATVMIFVRDAAETCIIDVDAADKINRHGTAQAAGNTIDSPGNAGDYVCLISHTNVDGSGTDGWIVVGYGKAVWTDGGAT